MLELSELQKAYDQALAIEEPEGRTQALLALASSQVGLLANTNTYIELCLVLALRYLRGLGLPSRQVSQALHWYNTARLHMQPTPTMPSLLATQGLSQQEMQELLHDIGLALRLEELQENGFESYE